MVKGKLAQRAAVRPLVEIPHHHRWHMKRVGINRGEQGANLLAPPQARQIEMHANHAQAMPGHRQLCHHRPARFQRWHVDRLGTANLNPLAHQYGIAMPANRRRTKIQRHGHIRRLGLQHRQRQRADPRAKAAVHLLQRNNIGIDFIQNRQDACRVAALIQPQRFTDIIGRNLYRVAHFGIMRSHRPYTGSGRICASISRPCRPLSAL